MQSMTPFLWFDDNSEEAVKNIRCFSLRWADQQVDKKKNSEQLKW